MKTQLNKFDRENLLDTIRELRCSRETKTAVKRAYVKKELDDAERNFADEQNQADPSPQRIDEAAVTFYAAQAFVNSLDIELDLISDNIEKLENILINNEF